MLFTIILLILLSLLVTLMSVDPLNYPALPLQLSNRHSWWVTNGTFVYNMYVRLVILGEIVEKRVMKGRDRVKNVIDRVFSKGAYHTQNST